MHTDWLKTLERLRGLDIITQQKVFNALSSVDRSAFVPEAYQDKAYEDLPLPIASGQTISAPHMVAMMLEALDCEPSHRVLEVGTGSGFHAACLAEMVGDTGRVDTLERIGDLHVLARKHLADYQNVHCYLHDGNLGLPEHAPYDRILITCAAKQLPLSCLAQLSVHGGKMVLPIEVANGQVNVCVTHDSDRLSLKQLQAVRFVPMCSGLS